MGQSNHMVSYRVFVMSRFCRHRFSCISIAILIGVGFLAITGCGSGDNRQALKGTVSWQDSPLPKGVITLYPKGEGSTVGCEVIDGKFAIAEADGATPGKYRVEILAFRPTGKTEFDIDQNKKVSIDEQFLPKQYNSSSTLEAEVVVGKPNSFDYALKPGK